MVYQKLINVSKHNLGASKSIKEKALQLRRNPTQQETTLWGYLKNGKINGMHFRRQHPYGIYIIDFYCFEAGLAVEVDGPIHLSKREYDVERTGYLESSGLKVLRFKNEDVEFRIDWVVCEIKGFAVKKVSLSHPAG